MGAKRKRIREFSEKECAKFLFGEEIGSLVDDERVHDGWRGELRMFSSVFHQNDDLLDNAKGSDTKLWPSVTIASDGCVPFQPGNAATSVIEYSCLPEGLEYQSSKARQLNPSFEFSASKGIGTSVGNDCGVLSSEAQKNLGIDLNIPSIADASLEKYFTALNPRPAEILGDGSLHLVSPEVVDGANEHSDKKETTQLRRKSIVESSRDIPKEVGMMLVLDTALIDTSSQKNFGTFSTRVQTIDREPLTLDMLPCESSISSEKDKSGTSRHLNEECAVSTSAGSNPTSTAGVSCSLVEVEPHGTESKQVNLQNDTPGSIVISVAHENSCGVLRSKENVVNNSLHGSGPMDTPSDHSSVACITRHEENYAHHSMPEMLLDAAENALKSVNAGITTHHITDLVIESLVPDNDICSQDCSTEKPRSWYDRRCKRQSSQKTVVTFDVSVLDTPTPDKGLAQETTNGEVVITPPVSQESSVSKASESNVFAIMDVDIQPVSQESSVSKASASNVLAIMDVDIQPVNIFEGKNETRTQEALLLMSDEVKTSWKKSFTAKLRTRLWQIIKDFLVAAGFEVQYWNRLRGSPDSIYVSPGKDQVRYASAVKAWKASADILFRGKKKTMLDAPTREWEDTTHFWVELTDVLALVGIKTRKMVHKTTMLKKWVLLDPFVTMLFIERLKPLKDRENANTSIRSVKGSTRLVRQRKLKSPVESGDPFVFRLDSELQLESDTTHNQLTDVLQTERNGDLGGTHVYAKIRSTALAKGSSGSRKHGFPSQTNRAVPEVMIGDDRRKSPVRGPLDDRCSVFEANVQAVKVYKCEVSKEIGRKKIKGITVPAKKVCQINDDDLLIASIIKNKDLGSNSPPILKSMKAKKKISRSARKLKSYRGGCKLLPRSPGKGGRHLLSGKQPVFYKRTVLSWMIDSGALFENAIVWYQSKSGTVVKNGWITRDGLLCKCCNKIFSLSEFKIHASSKVGRSSLNLFVGTGDSFTLCQLQAWSAEYKTRKAGNRVVDDPEIDLNDDTCGLCGDGGVLICCDNCPSTFHHTCLGNQLLPDNNWYCPYCTCEICGKAVVQPDTLSSSILMQCLQCERKYHKPCLSDSIQHGGDDPTKETWFCGENCHEIHSGLRSHLGVMHHIGEGFSWTLLKCIQSDQRVHSAQGIALMAECNTKLAVALSIMEECFVQMIDLRTGIDMIPHALYNWGSCFTRLNYQGFYTVVLEKGDEIISVASIRVHGVMVAELPLIATCSEYRRQGMCRRLMNAIEEVLMSVKVERMVILAIPELIDTWTSGFGFKQMDDSDKELFNNINLMIFPGTTLLEKRLHMPKNFQEKEIKHVTKKVCGRFEPDDPHSVVPVPEPGEQLAESCKDGVNVGLEPVQRNLRLEEISLNGSVLESALEVDPSSTTIESKHHNSQIGYTVNGYMAESVQVDQEKLDARLACISTGNPRHDAQIGVCTNMNESKDNSKENNAAGRDIPMVSVEGRNEVKLNHGDLGLTVSEHDSEGCKGNLEVSTELMKCSAPTCSTVCGHMIQSNCRSDYTQLVSRNTFQKMNNMITLTSAATDWVVDPENELFPAILGCPDSSLCSQHAPPFFISDISDGKITKDRLAAVDLLDLNSSVLCKDMRSSPTKDHVTHQSLLFEKDLVDSPFSNSTRLSHIKVNSTEDGDDVEKHHGKGLNVGGACVEKRLLDIATENGSRLLRIAVGSSSTESGVDVETVDRADNRVGKMTCMMSGSEVSGELENISLCESSVLIPQIDVNSSLNAPSFTKAATKEIVNASSFTSVATEEIIMPSMSKSPNLEEKSAVVITLPKSPAENIAAQTGILYPSTFEVTGFQGSTAGHSSVVTQSTTVGALQEPSRYVRVNGSPPGMNNPLTTSVNDKNAPSNEAGLDNSTGAQISKFTKGKYWTQKDIVLGLACQTYGVMHPKRSHVRGNGRNQRFRGK